MTLAYWHWITLGLAIVALEIMIPGAFLLWIGIAALILGGIIFVFPLPVTAQLVLFGILALLATVVGRKIIYFQARGEAPVTLNRRGQQLVGQTITLDVPIINNHAHVTIADSKWLIKGPDLPADVVVKVVGVDGNTLIVIKEDK